MFQTLISYLMNVLSVSCGVYIYIYTYIYIYIYVYIYEWHAEDWLNEQRLIHSSRNEYARTRTRAVRGPPAKRWFEGLKDATGRPARGRPDPKKVASIARECCR